MQVSISKIQDMEGINMAFPEIIFGFNLSQCFNFTNDMGFFFMFC